MTMDRREKRFDKKEYLELKREWEKEPGVKTFDVPDLENKLGWVSPTEEEREDRLHTANIDFLRLAVPELGAVENPLPYPTRVDGIDVINAYSQIGGTCVGASGAQATTGRHQLRGNLAPTAGKLFDYVALYCKCRALMNDPSCNKNAGATMQACGKALQNWGGVQIIDGKPQPANIDNGILSFSFGYSADAIRTGIGNNIYIQIGISIYQAFLSPKQIVNPITGKLEWWVYWQSGAWGSMLGGHAMLTYWWSDQRNAFFLPNSWGYDFPGSWMSRAAFDRLLGAAQPAEVLICIDRGSPTPVPTGKLELAEPFSISPGAPKIGDNVNLHLKVKNTGDGPLTGIGLAIEELHDGAGTDGYVDRVTFDLMPGATHEYNPVKTAIEKGTWRWWPDWYKDNVYKHLTDPMTITVSDVPPPPPPPPSDDFYTLNPETQKKDGVVYTTAIDQPNGVIFRKVP